MKVKTTYLALKELVELEGESAGRQLRLSRATQDLAEFSFGRKKLPACLVPSTDEERKSVAKVLSNMKTKDFGSNAVLLEPRTIRGWVDEIRRAAALQGRASDG